MKVIADYSSLLKDIDIIEENIIFELSIEIEKTNI